MARELYNAPTNKELLAWEVPDTRLTKEINMQSIGRKAGVKWKLFHENQLNAKKTVGSDYSY